jgi:hypothetical protein
MDYTLGEEPLGTMSEQLIKNGQERDENFSIKQMGSRVTMEVILLKCYLWRPLVTLKILIKSKSSLTTIKAHLVVWILAMLRIFG